MVCHGYAPIIKEPVTTAYRGRIINIHNTLLPWGRGLMGNVWSFFEDVPKGVSLHSIDPGIDTGDIFERRLVPMAAHETLKSSWDVLMEALEDLFMERWEDMLANRLDCIAQENLAGLGTYHDKKLSDRLLGLFPERWQTPVAQVAEMGRKYRSDPDAFVARYGFDPASWSESLPGHPGGPGPRRPVAVRFLPAGDSQAQDTPGRLIDKWLRHNAANRDDYLGWDAFQQQCTIDQEDC